MFSKKNNTAAALTAASALAGATLPAAEAEADLIRPDRTFQQYEDYALSKAEFSSTGYFNFTNYDGENRNTSGFYAGDGLFITTAHSLKRTSADDFYSNMEVGFGNNIFSNPGQTFNFTPQEGVNLFIRDGFTQAGSPNDIAILFIPELMNSGLSAAQVSQNFINGGVEFDNASFGAPGIAGEELFAPDGQFRAGQNKVVSVNGNFFEATFNTPGVLSSDLEFGLTSGSSGSPVFVDGLVYGIGNYQIGVPNMFSIGGYESLAPHYNWIEEVRTTVPTPGTGALLLGGALAYGRRRRQA